MWRGHREFTLAIGLGDGHHAALSGDDAGAGDAVRGALRAVCASSGMRAMTPPELAAASTDGGQAARGSATT